MNCPKCRFENPDGIKFCGECGAKLEIICPKCGFSNPPQFKFCGECGIYLKELAIVSPIDYTKPKSYTPKHLADKILTTRSALEGERKIVTVLFADVANYTSMSEKLDPEEVLQIMDGAFKIMMDETHKFEGTINQFTGDGIMAIFGAPVAHENHAQRACYTALAIQNAMVDYGAQIQKKYGLDFKMRIGINSGAVIVSAIGDDLRMDYTAVGDTTNLAARMESMANPGAIFVSTNTHKIVKRYFEFDPIGKIEVKGKEQPQDIYELKKAGDVVTRIDASIAKGLTRFVGRKNSMASLMAVYDQVESGSGQVVGIVGEAGVGKSRLLLEFRSRISEENHTYLEGQCLQYGGSILYKPILDILKTLFKIKDLDREHTIKKKIRDKLPPALEHAIPSFQDLLSVPVDDEAFLKLEPKHKREKAFEAIRDLLICISQEKPLVLVVEDLHWIDDSSEEFLNYLIEWIANSPIMLILLYRTEYQHKWGSKTYYHKIGLDHLGKESAIELVAAMLEDGDITSELRDLILSLAAGNPLFMEEFTHTLIENGTIVKQGNCYVLSRKITEIKVPDTVQGIIAARMDRLEENLKRTMQVASVIGRDFAFRILQTITGMHEELKSYLRNLQGLEFIYEKRLFPELEYIFKHALTQEVAYKSLLLKRRKQIHENIGKAIEELYSERLEEFYEMLAYHYSRSDNLEKAYAYLKLSGQKAFKIYANEEAYNFYKDALNILQKKPDTEEGKKEKIGLILLMHNPMALLSYPEGSSGILQAGEELSKELKDHKSLASFYGYISRYYSLKARPSEAIEFAEPRFIEAQKTQDLNLIAPLLYGLTNAYLSSGDVYNNLDIIPEVIALLEKTSKEEDFFGTPVNIYAYLNILFGSSLASTGSKKEGKTFIEKGCHFANKINDKIAMGLGELHFAQYYAAKGDGKNAINHSQNSIKLCQEGNFSYLISVGYGNLGYGYWLMGDLCNAEKHIKKGYEMHKVISITRDLPLYPLYLSHICVDSGELSKAQIFAEDALELAIKNGTNHFEALSMISMGRIIGEKMTSKSNYAENYILGGIKILEQKKHIYSRGYLILGELYWNMGECGKALNCLKKAESECQDMEIDYWLSFSKSLIGKTLSKLSSSQFNESEQTIFDAIKIAQEIESKPPLAMGHLCLGEIYADHGQKEKALENLKKAESMYQDMGMGLWLGKTREILNRL
jgi:class 3 adenylate cyclase/tetratricopeptide (TPR) repeat protein